MHPIFDCEELKTPAGARADAGTTCEHCDAPATEEQLVTDDDGFVVVIKDLCAGCASKHG
jgi:Fe-S-cluster-containing dehydrogenase component